MEALAEIEKPPHQLLEKELNWEWAFLTGHCPSEQTSDAEPPIRLADRTETIPIDRLLGIYDPSTQGITIFSKGIEQVAALLSAHPRDLMFIVRLHEWAHALLHIAVPKNLRSQLLLDESSWSEYLANATAWFGTLDTPLHERLAQLLTHHALCSLESATTLPESRAALQRRRSTFQQLTRRAPTDYHIEGYVNIPKPRLLLSIRLLKACTLIGFNAWETTITW